MALIWLTLKSTDTGQNIVGRCQQTFENKKFVDITQQCFALLPQVNFPANNLNFNWRWRDWIQAIFLNLFYFIWVNCSQSFLPKSLRNRMWSLQEWKRLFLCYNSSRPLTQTLPFTNVSCGNRVRGKSNIGRSLASDMYWVLTPNLILLVVMQ